MRSKEGALAHEIQQLAADALNGISGNGASTLNVVTVNVVLEAIHARAGAIIMANVPQDGKAGVSE